MSLGLVQLLKNKGFLGFFFTQFFGAFNDNAFKLAMLTLISYHLSTSQAQSEYYQALAGALFIVPFFIFSASSGQLVDKYDKGFLARLVKLFELVLMVIGSFALYLHSLPLLLVILTGMGLHSTFFGPIKYAILPDLLQKKDLLAANALIQASTFIAILLGTILGTVSIGVSPSIPYAAMLLTLGAAVCGLIASFFIPKLDSGFKELPLDVNIWRATVDILKQAKVQASVFLCILTISWFWLVGSIVLTKLPDYTHYVLACNTNVFALFLFLFSVGLAAGSLMIKIILKENLSLSIVPWIILAFSFFAFDLFLASPTSVPPGPLLGLASFFKSFMSWRIAVDLFMLAFCGGMFIVPLYTHLQIATDRKNRARIIAANNVYNSLFMVLGSLLLLALLYLKFTIPQVFLIIAILNIGVAFYFKSSHAFAGRKSE